MTGLPSIAIRCGNPRCGHVIAKVLGDGRTSQFFAGTSNEREHTVNPVAVELEQHLDGHVVSVTFTCVRCRTNTGNGRRRVKIHEARLHDAVTAARANGHKAITLGRDV